MYTMYNTQQSRAFSVLAFRRYFVEHLQHLVQHLLQNHYSSGEVVLWFSVYYKL